MPGRVRNNSTNQRQSGARPETAFSACVPEAMIILRQRHAAHAAECIQQIHLSRTRAVVIATNQNTKRYSSYFCCTPHHFNTWRCSYSKTRAQTSHREQLRLGISIAAEAATMQPRSSGTGPRYNAVRTPRKTLLEQNCHIHASL